MVVRVGEVRLRVGVVMWCIEEVMWRAEDVVWCTEDVILCEGEVVLWVENVVLCAGNAAVDVMFKKGGAIANQPRPLKCKRLSILVVENPNARKEQSAI
jgi:hypothetical protein